MKKYLYFICIFFLSLMLNAQEGAEKGVIPAAEYKKAISTGNVQLVDVRTPEEFAEAHIEGAVNIDFFADDFLLQFAKLDKNKPVYIYCRSGNRSSKAAEKLEAAGFKRIIDLKGGFKAWLPVKENR